MTPIIDAFRNAIAQAGLTAPDPIVADGKLHRFATNGRRDDDSGWYVLYDDGVPAGAFGDWRTGTKETWCGKSDRQMSESERTQYRQRLAPVQRARDEAQRRRDETGAQRASTVWASLNAASLTHPYLIRKQVKPYEIRQFNSCFPGEAGGLAIPMCDESGTLYSIQSITANGAKSFMTRARVRGCFHLIGEVGEVLCLCEGYATAASIHEATGYPAAVAFSAGNLLPVAHALRDKHPHVTILLCGDHDKSGVGQKAAQEAAEAISGLVVIPTEEGMDWNDVAVTQGLGAVKVAIETAIRPREHPPMENDPPFTPSADAAHLHTPPALARDPHILARFEQAVRVCGVVGEERCAKLLYLSLTSRVLMEPVSLAIKGLSSSGKSFTTETTLKFFPKAAYIAMTAMSERALVYMKEDFKHKALVIFEAVALREQREKNESNLTAYFVRSLLSEGRISYPVTVRDNEGGFITKTIVKEGPTNVILTTTATQLHGENETRLLSLPTNDSTEQTKAVMVRLAEGQLQEMNVQEWHELQNWLTKAEHRVVIPFAAYLAESIPPVAVRLRRDFKALLRLIETHAILHQCSRAKDDDGRIVAQTDDYLTVRALVADLIASGVGATVPETMRATVQAVRDFDLGEGVTVRRVADVLKLDRSAAQRRLTGARERGYLTNLEEKRGRPARWAIGDPLPEEQELLPLDVPRGVQHSPVSVQDPENSISPSDTETFAWGVQLCSDSGDIESDNDERHSP